MRTLEATATRSGGWWAIEVPAIPGVFSQARRLDQVADMAADAVRTLTGEDVTITVRTVLADTDAAELVQVRRETEQAAQAAVSAARRSRSLVARLRSDGLTVRDIATLLEISPQRVSQLAAATPATTRD